MRGGGVRIEGESGAEGNEGGIFRSTLAASEWPAEKREGPRGPGYCLHAVDPLRLDKKKREREREGSSHVVVSTHPLSDGESTTTTFS